MKAGNCLGSAATGQEKRLQCLLVSGSRALSHFPTLQLWVWPPDSKIRHHLLQFFDCKACPKRQSVPLTRLQVAILDPHRP
jgi:hypothetical protein